MKQIYFLLTTVVFLIYGNEMEAQTIWTGADLTFNKASNADWTLSSNQDTITSDIILTRQNSRPIYNYQWFQNTFGEDANLDDLRFNFWSGEYDSTHIFTATGGPKGLKWAILDDTGSTTDWSGFTFYGTLGNPSNFYSFHNIASMIRVLEDSGSVTSVDDDFNINGDTNGSNTRMLDLVGKKLGVWIEDEDIYFTLTFTTWGRGDDGSKGAVSYTRSTAPTVIDSTVIDSTVNINEFELDNPIQLYPNPSSEIIQIFGLKENTSYKIFNILGTEIKTGLISNNKQINIRNLTKGMYFFKFENGNAVKFIKE